MLRFRIKTFNKTSLYTFSNIINNFKIPFSLIKLPVKSKVFVVKKSPHVFGRSKEKYYLKTYSCIIIFKFLRKQDLFRIIKIFKPVSSFKNLGIQLTVF